MRTNVEIDDNLMARAMSVSGATTKRETVDLALRELVNREERLKILELRGKIDWVGDLDEMRHTRSW